MPGPETGTRSLSDHSSAEAGIAGQTSTVAGLIQDAAISLERVEIEGARSEARRLLAHVLGETESALLAHAERAVPHDLTEQFRALVERRTRRVARGKVSQRAADRAP